MSALDPYASPYDAREPQPVLYVTAAVLFALGLTSILLGEHSISLELRARSQIFGILLYAVAAALLVPNRRWRAWLPAGAGPVLVALLMLAAYWFGLIALLFLPLPLLVAGAMGERRNVVAVLLLQLLFLLAAPASLPLAVRLFGSTALVIYSVLLYLTVRPLHHVAAWSWGQYERTRQLMEEARTRQADLEWVLDELTHANRQLDLLNERLAAMRFMAEEAHRAKANFVAKVSHEFRTPLNMIIGLTDLLIETPDIYGDSLPAPLLHDLRIVHSNCEHLASMVNDVLDLSQTEAGRLTLHREWVALQHEIAAAARVVSPLIEKKGLHIELDLPGNMPDVYCDRTRIRQVILNLVSNAARYTEQGKIAVKAEVESNYVVVCVSDTGPGIAREEMAQLFEPFFQAESSVHHSQRGAGLGLAISKQFIELHDGRLWAESQLGAGSRFCFRLPIAPLSAPTTRPDRWINEEWHWHERTNRAPLPVLPNRKRIVVYDPMAELYSALEALTGDEVEFVLVQDVQEAAAALRACPAHAVLVQADEDEVFAQVEKLKQVAPDTLVMACCAPWSAEQALQRGAAEYLIKPITRADLRGVLSAFEGPLRRILVVDDDAEIRHLWERMLRTLVSEVEIIQGRDGQEAIELMAAVQPDLVLLDVVLPRLTGWEVLAHVRQADTLAKIPIVMVSSQDPIGTLTSHTMLVAATESGFGLEQTLNSALALSSIILRSSEEPLPTPQ